MIKNFIQAARLRTLPLSVSGIIIGSFLAASSGNFNWKICVLALLTTLGFQILSNFANDFGDGIKGTDNHNRVGPKRAIQSGTISKKQMLVAILITTLITLFIAVFLIYSSFGVDNLFSSILFLILGIASLTAAIKYTVGKNAYGYNGLGDVFVFLFFGLLSVCGSYFLFTHKLPLVVFLPAASVGFLSAGVLNLNNMRDRASDVLSNKNTLVVKIGISKARKYHFFLLIASLVFAFCYVLFNYQKPINFLFLIAYIPIIKHFKVVYKNINPQQLDPELKKLALSTVLFSILFGLGFIL